MELHNFTELTNLASNASRQRTVAIVSAADRHILETALKAAKKQIARPLLIGSKSKISALLNELQADPKDFQIEEPSAHMTDAELAVQLIHSKDADLLMKGMLETSDFLRPVVNRQTGLGTGRIMSHIALQSIPGYHKLVINTDAAMCAHPDLNQKKEILLNAVHALHKLGYTSPNVACLCCKESVDAKIIETVHARTLQEMCEKNELGSCHVAGPISYDIAISKEIARLKHFDSPYCGDFDVLLQPNIHAGNILGKCLEVTCRASMAGIVVGAKAPVILTSRGAKADEKLNSIAFASAVA
ncbi:Phosphate acetyltransferase [uncultured Roseburia sp.]|uniref:Phosphate acyltransferase n=1 Tax=Brotonthovivens ammoniilytica TaxID=2981725 RepID=A0ABT2TF81_9FIRM|nr:phosphate acyltransferase [Brotonthovivens ammoniilytica]MCU6760850.1 phosphate acyltransferase [Brotonthovivens ammoniilytica]SCI11161.1 Phosphate acetyltransferase [uncultured Roseburia sp.]